jgi:hypothetical protein
VNKYGIHLPNGGNDWLADVLRLGVSHYTLLHTESWAVSRLREASPDGVILVRFYLPNWSARNPRDWAAECERLAQPTLGLGVHYTPANEQNLPSEGGGWTADCYQRIADWNDQWREEFQRRTGVGADRLHWPAFAYGHSDDQNDSGYVGFELCRPAVERYGVIDVHPYWFAAEQRRDRYYGHRFVLVHQLFPAKPIFCSEAGNFAVERPSTPDEIIDWFESLYEFPYVIGGTPFIFRDPTQAHQVNDWGRNREIERRVVVQPKRSVIFRWPESKPVAVRSDVQPKALQVIDGITVYDVRERYPETGIATDEDADGRYDRRDPTTIENLIVHNSETGEAHSLDEALRLADSIYTFHTGPERRWPAIAYHFLAFPFGLLWTNGLDVVSYHTAGQNARGVGICLLGNFENSPLPGWVPPALRAARRIVEQAAKHPVALYGHKEIAPASTEWCPTRRWSEWKRGIEMNTVSGDKAKVIDALNGIWHFLNQADAALGAARSDIQEVRKKIVELKVALGLQ